MAEEIPPASQSFCARRLPLGLTFAMAGLAVSIAFVLILWNLRWPTAYFPALLVHGCAVLCLAWGVVAQVVARTNPEPAAHSIGHDLLSVLNVTQLLCGLCTGVVMLYLALVEVFARMYQPQLHVELWPTGMLDIAVVAVAALLAWWRTGHGSLMTSLVWLLVLMSLWAALQSPPSVVREAYGIPSEVRVDWVSPFMLGSAFAIAAFTALSGMLANRWRQSAWPDHLDRLLTPPPAWPGFTYSVGTLAAMVMVLSCIVIVSPLTPPAALMAGASMMALAARRWNDNLADAGLGLITIGVISLLMFGLPEGATRAEYYAAAFGRTLLGLAVMTGFWHWLAAVWDQQLDRGEPWTTAGRLIRPCHRVGFLLGATGVLVSLELAFWPKLPYVYVQDNTLGRWIWGLSADFVLLLTLFGATRRTGKPTLGWLCLFSLASMCSFVIIRGAGTFIYRGFLTYWPLILAGAAAVCLLAAWRAAKSTRSKAFLEPLYVSGIFLLPVSAITGAAWFGSLAIPPWVVPATFATLAVAYLIAGRLTGPRRLTILTWVCAGAALWRTLRP